jgi:hypothetical protein
MRELLFHFLSLFRKLFSPLFEKMKIFYHPKNGIARPSTVRGLCSDASIQYHSKSPSSPEIKPLTVIGKVISGLDQISGDRKKISKMPRGEIPAKFQAKERHRSEAAIHAQRADQLGVKVRSLIKGASEAVSSEKDA